MGSPDVWRHGAGIGMHFYRETRSPAVPGRRIGRACPERVRQERCRIHPHSCSTFLVYRVGHRVRVVLCFDFRERGHVRTCTDPCARSAHHSGTLRFRRRTRGYCVLVVLRFGLQDSAPRPLAPHTLSVIMPSRPGPRKIPVGSPKILVADPVPEKHPSGPQNICVPCRAAKRDHLEREFGVSPRSIPVGRAARRDHLEREFGSSSHSIPACRAAKRDHLEREFGVSPRSVPA